MLALSGSAELQEYPPGAPPSGSGTFTSLCNMRNWAVCGCPLPSTLSRQSACWGSSHLLAWISDPLSPHPLRRNSPCAINLRIVGHVGTCYRLAPCRRGNWRYIAITPDAPQVVKSLVLHQSTTIGNSQGQKRFS